MGSLFDFNYHFPNSIMCAGARLINGYRIHCFEPDYKKRVIITTEWRRPAFVYSFDISRAISKKKREFDACRMQFVITSSNLLISLNVGSKSQLSNFNHDWVIRKESHAMSIQAYEHVNHYHCLWNTEMQKIVTGCFQAT